MLRQLAHERGEWAGIPLPVEGTQLVIEPTYPYAGLANLGKPEVPADGLPVRRILWSTKYRCDFAILERPDGKVVTQPIIGTSTAADLLLSTIGASFAWGLEQEQAAVNLLGTLVSGNAFKQYMLTGMFLESSRRSGVTYVFRRLRPTVALTARDGFMRILTTLCMHPIGYYSGSWAGAMCPTDDVIAHLMLMRGDEPMLWRRCNQHPPGRRESGL